MKEFAKKVSDMIRNGEFETWAEVKAYITDNGYDFDEVTTCYEFCGGMNISIQMFLLK